MGRPPKGGDNVARIVSFRLSESVVSRLDACAKALDLTRTDVVECGIDMVLEKLERKKGD